MDASITAPRIIGGDILKFFVSSNLCQDGSGRLFFVCVFASLPHYPLHYIYKIVYKLFSNNPLV